MNYSDTSDEVDANQNARFIGSSVDEARTNRQGFLLGIDRQLRNRLRLGIGYNFTDFADDLTYLDYDKQGWLLNIVGQH